MEVQEIVRLIAADDNSFDDVEIIQSIIDTLNANSEEAATFAEIQSIFAAAERLRYTDDELRRLVEERGETVDRILEVMGIMAELECSWKEAERIEDIMADHEQDAQGAAALMDGAREARMEVDDFVTYHLYMDNYGLDEGQMAILMNWARSVRFI